MKYSLLLLILLASSAIGRERTLTWDEFMHGTNHRTEHGPSMSRSTVCKTFNTCRNHDSRASQSVHPQ